MCSTHVNCSVTILIMYIDNSKSNASYLCPWKLQQEAQYHYLIEQIHSYKTLFSTQLLPLALYFCQQ